MKPLESHDGHEIYEPSFSRAANILRNINVDYLCEQCGIHAVEGGVVVPYFNEEYEVRLPEVVFEPPGLSTYEQILILHYITTLENHPAQGTYVSFKNLPGASFYDTAYRKRGPEKIIKTFGDNIDSLVGAAERLGGERADAGDVSARLQVFPKVEAIVALYRGDEEFPPEANILFRDDIINFLPLEDIAVLAGVIASRLKKSAQQK